MPLALALLVALAGLLIAPAAAAAATGISGTVTDTGNNPLHNITVCVLNAAIEFGAPEGCKDTGPGGEYEIEVPAGAHKVQFSSHEAPGYVFQFYNGKPSFSVADQVSVNPGEMRPGINAKLAAGGAISGKVTSTSDVPIEALQVCAQKPNGEMLGPTGCSQTNASGEYEIVGLPAAEYEVNFTNNSCGGGGCSRVNWAPEYYNDRATIGEADPVTVTTGATQTGINAKLEKGATISGTVFNTAKTPLAGISVCVQQSAGYGDCTQTDAEGHYKVIGLPSGEYRIGFSPAEGSYYIPQYWSHKSRFYEADLLTLTAGEAKAGIDGELEEGGRITGTVTNVSHTAIKGIGVCALEPASEFGQPVECAQTNASGEYRLSLAAGSYKIQFSGNSCGPEGCFQLNYVRQYYNGKPSFSGADLVNVTEGGTSAGINAAMAAGGSIGGKVTEAGSNAPIEGLQVCVHEPGNEYPQIECAPTNASGEYAFTGLAAGQYKVQFTNNSNNCNPEGCEKLNYVPQYYNGKPSFSGADLVNVTQGGTSTGINATMAAGGSISGKVTKAATADPIAGLQVCAIPASGAEGGECANTDGSGEYTLSGLSAGQYKVQFTNNSNNCGPEGCEKLNYVQQFYDGKSNFNEADPVSVSAGQTKTGIDAAMEEGGSISGKVTDASTGDPIEGLQVCANQASGSEPEGEGECARTDGAGEYTLSGLSAGQYKVQFTNNSNNCGPEGCEKLNYVQQFYDGKSNFNEADPVSVSAGQTKTGIDAAMEESGSISGKVTDASTGDPIEGLQVCANPASGAEGGECANTGPDGEYTIQGLPPGDYKVEFSNWSCNEQSGCSQLDYVHQFYNGKSQDWEADPVHVTQGATTSHINAAMQAGGAIAGKVTDASTGVPIAGLQVCANTIGGGEYGECAQTDQGGDYTIHGLPAGEYKVEFGNWSCDEEECTQLNYVRQYYNGKANDSEANPVKVTSGATTPNVNAQMQAGGSIGGTVTSSVHAPIPGLLVCAYPAGSAEPSECAGSDVNGDYTILGLAAGQYKVEFSNRHCEGQGACEQLPYVPEFYNDKASLGEADFVSVTSGQTTQPIDAELETALKPVNTAPPTLSGTPAVGEVLSCSQGGWEHSPTSFAFAWMRDGTTITGQNASTYTVQAGDQGHGISCKVTATNAGGSATATSKTLQVPSAPPSTPAPVNTSTPVLSGNAAVGQALSCSNGSWQNSPTSFAYTWMRDGATITGQNASTYTVQAGDQGHGISCKVTATNAGGSATATSNALQVPSPTPLAQVATTAKVKSGKVQLRLTCSGSSGCKGVVKLIPKGKSVVIGKANFSIGRNETKTIAVKLTSKGKKLVSQAGKKGLKVKVAGTGVNSRTVTLKLQR